jgi:outer membrane protein assembly factor BamB
MSRLPSGAGAFALVLMLVLLSACGGSAAMASRASTSPSASQSAIRVPEADWPEFDYNAQRGGVGPADAGITAGDLHLLRRQTVSLDGTVDSSVIELHAVEVRGRSRDVLVMTTTYGKTIALDARTGAKLWEYTPADIGSYVGTAQVTTATPVADRSRRFVYSASPDGMIHKLSVANGSQVRSGGWPVRITYDPTKEKIAAALNISGNWVVATTGGYIGDIPVYQGHVVVIDRTTGRIVNVWNSLCSGRHHLIDPPSSCPVSDSAIWARAGAVIVPGSRRILVATGNAPFNGSTNWGDSVLELAPDASRLLHSWTPTDQAQLNADDGDLGSTAPALLPGTNLAVQGGKAGVIDLLNLNALDGTTQGAGPRTGGQLQQLSSPGGGQVLTAPAVWSHGGRIYVFVADDSGTTAYVLGSNRRLSVGWQNGTPGTSPVLAGGLLYIYDEVDGALVVRQPTTGRVIASLPAGTGHWNSPIVVGGRIILPEGTYHSQSTTGVLDIYHLPGR